jgi:thioesterase domain-containing protein
MPASARLEPPQPAPRLRLASVARARPARDPLDVILMDVWEETLGRRPHGIDESFISLGATPRVIARMRERVREACGLDDRLAWLSGEETIEELAARLFAEHRATGPRLYAARRPALPTVFLVHGDVNGGGFYVGRLARLLEDRASIYALPPHEPGHAALAGGIEAMAADYLAMLRARQPRGPYWLAGYCNGALGAFELARMLEAAGETVAAVTLVDPGLRNSPMWFMRRPVETAARWLGVGALRRQRIVRSIRDRCVATGETVRRLVARLRHARRTEWWNRQLRRRSAGASAPPRVNGPRRALTPEAEARSAERRRRFDAYLLACRGFIPGRYRGRITTIWAERRLPERSYNATHGFPRLARSGVRMVVIPGTHQNCMVTYAARVAEEIRADLDAGAAAR